MMTKEKNKKRRKRSHALLSVILSLLLISQCFMGSMTVYADPPVISGTLIFSGSGFMNVGQIVHDAEIVNGISSTDISGIQLDIFNTNETTYSSNPVVTGSFVYMDADNAGTTFGGVQPIDVEDGTYSQVEPPKILVIKSNDGCEFSLLSIYLTDGLCMETSVKFEGFKDGVSTGHVVLTRDEFDTEETYSVDNGLTASIFGNVDEVRITNQEEGGNYVGINNIEIGDPVIASSDAGLTSVLEQTITAGIESGTPEVPKTASINVANTITAVSAGDIVKSDAEATVTFYGTNNTFSSPEAGSVNLTSGDATNVYIKVVAADNTTLYYKVTINRAAAAGIPQAPTATAGEEYIDVTNVEAGATLELYTALDGQLASTTYRDMGNGTYRFEDVLPNSLWYYVIQSVGGNDSANSTFVNPSFRTPSATGGVEYVDVTNVSSNATIRLYKVGGGMISDSPTPMGNGTYRFENVTPDSAGFYVIQYANNIESANCPFFGVNLRTPSISGGNNQITVSNIFSGAKLTLYDYNGSEIETANNVTAATYDFANVAPGSGYYVQQAINGVLSLPSNAAAVYSSEPQFVGGAQSITVRQYPNPTDLRDQLYVSDLDVGQTLTWTVVSGPSHGTLDGFPATASTNGSGGIYGTVGGTDIRIPTAVTYIPAQGYVGDDNFTIQVSDGTATDTRTINVSVNHTSGTTVNAENSVELTAAINNPAVATIILMPNTTYQIGGAEINRPLTIRGNGATIEVLSGVGQSFDDQTIYHLGMPDGEGNRRYRGNIFWYVKDGGSLTIENLTLRNTATTENAQGLTGIFAAILLNDNADLDVSGVVFDNFWFKNSKLAEQNNLLAAQGLGGYTTYSDLSYGVYGDYNCTGNITIDHSIFSSSNAFRDAVHIYNANNVTLDYNTFTGTNYPDRLRESDAFEYGMYLYGGNYTVTNNTIRYYDSYKIPGYSSAGIALLPYNDADATLEDNTIQGNTVGLEIVGGWKALNPAPNVIINAIELDTEDDGFKTGEVLKTSNTISGSTRADIFIKLDQNDDDNAFVYYSPFLSISGTNTTGPTLNFAQTASAIELVSSAITIEVEKSEDNGLSWTAASVEGTLDNSSTSAVVNLEANKTYNLRVKMTHNNNQDPNTVITGYSNAVTFTATSLSSDATLKASSKVKGQTVVGLGTPNGALASVTAGSVTISSAQAANTSNAGSYVTLFEPSDSNVNSVKVVKYASGSTVTEANFESAAAYGNEAISNNDFFIIKVVAEDGATTLYYKVNVTVTPLPQPGVLAFSNAAYTIGEDGASVTITVTRTGGSDGAVSVDYATSNGTATTGSDYTAVSGTLSFADGDTASKTFTVAISQDAILEGNETVNLTLSNATGGVTLGQSSATLTITDDEVSATFTPSGTRQDISPTVAFDKHGYATITNVPDIPSGYTLMYVVDFGDCRDYTSIADVNEGVEWLGTSTPLTELINDSGSWYIDDGNYKARGTYSEGSKIDISSGSKSLLLTVVRYEEYGNIPGEQPWIYGAYLCAIPQKITYNLNGGNIDGDTAAKTEYLFNGDTLATTFNAPTKGDSPFKGWYTAGTGGSKVTSATNSSATYYAQWEDKLPVNNTAGAATVAYAGTDIDLTAVSGLFTLDSSAGAQTFTIEEGGTGAGTISGNLLTVTEAGTIEIGLTTAETSTHQAGAKITATITVDKGTQDAPAGLGKIDVGSYGGSDGKITGLIPNRLYEYKKDGGAYTAVTANTSGEITGLSAGTYVVRFAGNDLYHTGSDSAEIIIGQVTQPGAPIIQSAIPGNGQVTIAWSEVPDSMSYNVYSSITSGTYTTPATTVIEAVYSCDVTGLTNGTTYFFVVTAVGAGGESTYSNEASATPRTIPGVPTNVSATAGNGQATVSFTAPANNGGSAITEYIVTSSPGNITVTGTGTTITVTGLSNGTTYTFTVKAVNIAGNGADSAASNAVTPQSPPRVRDSDESSGGNTTPAAPAAPTAPAAPAATGADILVNGKVEKAGTATTTKEGDKTVTTVVVDDKKVEEKLQQEGNHAVVTIPVQNNADIVVGTLNAQTVKNMENKEAVLEIKTENISYVLPAQQINIDSVSAQMGAAVELKDIAVNIRIAATLADTVKIVEDTANKNSYQIIVKPVDFEITCTRAEKTIQVEKFNSYVERIISIPAGVDPSKITTGIVLNADGSFSHVPTEIFTKDGGWYAKLNSLTNSTYSIIWNPVTVAAVDNHWSKEAVNDMASRLVIKNPESFNPGGFITRGEFAEYITKALGLYRVKAAKAGQFSDVSLGNELADAITIAAEYGIITGYTDGSFGPDVKITREEAMVMYARAMDIVKLREAGSRIEGYKDKTEISGWAYSHVKKVVSAGVFNGKTADTIDPKGVFTYAEAATAIRNLLIEAKLINK